MRLSPTTRTILLGLALVLLVSSPVVASSGDRNPTYQHCLKGCKVSRCEAHQPPIAFYLRALGWTCAEDCAYHCSHAFTDNVRPGSMYHQFYGKWAFYRFFGIQEPVSVLMSIGNLWVNLRGIGEIKRRVRVENKLRLWLETLGWVQVNTWFWSAIFHSRDTQTTELLDYFSATLTISLTLLYTVSRIFGLQSPMGHSRLLVPLIAGFCLLVLSHFTYVLSFPRTQFPYGYHTAFNVLLGVTHNIIWILYTLSFIIPFPSMNAGRFSLAWPQPYPPRDPLTSRPLHAFQPAVLVIFTTLAMSLELFDFAPYFRMFDAHSLWHMATIPLGIAWWHFLCADAIELEGSLMGGPTTSLNEKMPLSGGQVNLEPPSTPTFVQIAAGATRVKLPVLPAKSPGKDEGRED